MRIPVAGPVCRLGHTKVGDGRFLAGLAQRDEMPVPIIGVGGHVLGLIERLHFRYDGWVWAIGEGTDRLRSERWPVGIDLGDVDSHCITVGDSCVQVMSGALYGVTVHGHDDDGAQLGCYLAAYKPPDMPWLDVDDPETILPGGAFLSTSNLGTLMRLHPPTVVP